MSDLMTCIDFSDITESVIDAACEFAAALDRKVILVYVRKHYSEKVSHVTTSDHNLDISRDMIKENNQMANYESRIKEKGIPYEVAMLTGSPSDALIKKGRELGASLVIIGSRTTSAATHMIKGSVGADLLKKLRVPVVLVPEKKQ